jgi:phage terminase large subunit-like protein
VNPARGAIQILGKNLLRKTLGRSPERLDAVVMGLAASMGGIRQPTIRFCSMSM